MDPRTSRCGSIHRERRKRLGKRLRDGERVKPCTVIETKRDCSINIEC